MRGKKKWLKKKYGIISGALGRGSATNWSLSRCSADMFKSPKLNIKDIARLCWGSNEPLGYSSGVDYYKKDLTKREKYGIIYIAKEKKL